MKNAKNEPDRDAASKRNSLYKTSASVNVPPGTEYIDGGTVEERLRASGIWKLLPASEQENIRRMGRVLFAVDGQTGRVLGCKIERNANEV
ncbi:hypothetical protein LP421_08450 [Rhizobium sp. RCAM05350]|nr:hypothetical protein LP421_08450 [Rhizobium sp. RCAM05350]